LIPFHPDESTYLYMSSDFDWLWSEPLSLTFNPHRLEDPRQIYRLLDAPLTRYLLGVGRTLAGLSAVPVDWDWAKSWQANSMIGALPGQPLLNTGRLLLTLLLPFSLTFIYLAACSAGGRLEGFLAALLLGTHALVLLHARRAMAEGPLLFAITGFLASLSFAERRPWLVGLAAALAFNAKHSALALLPVGLIAVAWLPTSIPPKWARIVFNVVQFLTIYIGLTLALNPLFWREPWLTAQAMIQTRQDLLNHQVADARQFFPEQVLETPWERGVMLLGHLYLAPPMFAEVGNYRAETAPAEKAYLAVPGHSLGRNPIGASLWLGLSFLGMVWAGREAFRAGYPLRRQVALLLLATAFQATGMVLAIPLAWQRYSLPLVPFVCVWTGIGAGRLIRMLRSFNLRSLKRS